MVPLFVLLVAFAVFTVLGKVGVAHFRSWQTSLRYALAAMFLLTASAHWGTGRADLIAMVPPLFPRPDLLVTLTGILEILGAIGLIVPRTSRGAAASLIVLLLAMFPANVYAALNQLQVLGAAAMSVPLRGALQLVFILALSGVLWRPGTVRNPRPAVA